MDRAPGKEKKRKVEREGFKGGKEKTAVIGFRKKRTVNSKN